MRITVTDLVIGTLSLLLIATSLGIAGCSSPRQSPKAVMKVAEGILVDMDVSNEDGSTTCIMLEFADGRIQKTRLRYNNPVVFRLNKWNVINMDENGTIIHVEVDEGDLMSERRGVVD